MIRWDTAELERERAQAMTDADLLAAYQTTDGVPGSAYVDALVAEIERRNLDL